jgi:hypothetical protein
MSFVLI